MRISQRGTERPRWVWVAVWLFAMGCFAGWNGQLFAQSSTATIVGSVTDSTGAVIQGATITLTNLATGAVRQVVTDAAGRYSAPSLPVGTYTVAAAAKGFDRVVRNNVVTVVDQVAQVPFVLKVGEESTSVNVNAAPPMLESQTSDVGAVITPEQVQNAPLNARNFTQLATLIPGVVRGQIGSPTAGGGSVFGSSGAPTVGTEGFRYQTSGGSDLSIGGLRPGNNSFLLDGVDNNEPMYGETGIFPPPDSIEEFKIITANPPAEYGRAAGGVVAVVTKSGTNNFHGSVYDFLRNSALDARNFFQPATILQNGKEVPNPKYHLVRNEWGATFGGPIVKNRTFFFFDYNGFRNSYPATTGWVTVPTAKVRQGDFSEYGVTVCDPSASTPASCNPKNPASPGTFLAETGANQIPASRLDKAAVNLLNAFPMPNGVGPAGAGMAGLINNYYVPNQPRVENQFHIDLKLDQELSASDQLNGRLTWDNMYRTTPSIFPKVPAGFGTGREQSLTRGVQIGETHVFTSNLLNEFHFGFLKTGVAIHEPGVDGYGGLPVNYGEQLGIANANPAPGAGGLPEIALQDGLFSNGGWVGDGGTYDVPSDTYQFEDAVSYHHGNHDIKTGVSLIHRVANDAVGNTSKGVFIYQGLSSNGTTTGNSISDMLLGVDAMGPQGWCCAYGRGPLLEADQSWDEVGSYIQDDYHVTDKLTLNLGLRYDLFTTISEAKNRLANFNPATGTMVVASDGNNLIRPDLNNWGPHLGFAWRMQQNTVLRGGFSVMYTMELPGFNGATPNLAFNAPFTGFDTFNPVTDANGWGTDLPLSGGYPLFAPNIDPGHPTGSVIYEDPNKRTPYIYTYDLGIEHQIGTWLLSVAGVGNDAHKLGALGPLDTTPYQTQDPGLSNVTAWEGKYNSNYSSLQFRAQKHFANGLGLISSYTWAHCLDYGAGIVSAAGFGGGNFPEDPKNLRLEYGDCANDVRQVASQSVQWALPFGHGQAFGRNWSGALQEALGGWTIADINYMQSGDHLTPTTGGVMRMDPVAGMDPNAGPHTINEWFNPKAFIAPPAGTDGLASRGLLLGPARWNADISLLKDFGLGAVKEGMTAQFRATFYNAFNHVQLADPNAGQGNAVQSGGFGTITNAYPQREIEFTLKILF